MNRFVVVVCAPLVLVEACDGSARVDTGGGGRGGGNAGAGTGGTGGAAGASSAPAPLASKYPCDQGIASDPAVLWAENFEEGTVAAVTARYESAANPPGMTLVGDVPARSCGHASMKLTASAAQNATDLYKKLPDRDELFVRYYAKYQAGVEWHHSGMWFGGYRPALSYPSPRAGLKPDGSERISVAIEPVWGSGAPNPRFDTYNYWRGMRSWMDQPSGDAAYYGNSVVHRKAFTANGAAWTCLEIHVKLNTDVATSAGAELDVWQEDGLVQHFDSAAPVGCWIKDKFCASGADGNECTDYPNLCAKPYVPLDLRWRTTTELHLNYFWPQNYITEGLEGALQLDDMIVATTRVGCLR